MGIPAISHYDAPTGIQLSRSPLPWSIAADRAALLVHDMQNYFLRRYESALFVGKLVANIDSIRQRCHRLGVPTFFTAQRGGQPRSTRGLLMDFWGTGMPAEREAQAIVGGLEPVAGKDTLLPKHRYSAFINSDLLERLREQGRTQLIICGVYAHIGCLITATDAFMADIQPFFVADALGDFSLEHHETALRHVAHCSGRVLSTTDTLEELCQPG